MAIRTGKSAKVYLVENLEWDALHGVIERAKEFNSIWVVSRNDEESSSSLFP